MTKPNETSQTQHRSPKEASEIQLTFIFSPFSLREIMGLREREIRAPRADLAKIGREGFELIDEFFGRAPAARRAAARPTLPQPPRKVEQPPRKRKEKPAVAAAANCNQVAKARGGVVITTWRAFAK